MAVYQSLFSIGTSRFYLNMNVVKKRLQQCETRFDGHVLELSTLKKRDDNDLRTMKLVEEYTSVPVPKLIHAGDRYAIFCRTNHSPLW